MNICRKFFFFRKILKEVRPVELRGEAFLALFFVLSNLTGGFHKFETPCDVPDSVFALHLRQFFVFFFKSEKVRSRKSQGLSDAALESGLLK